MSRPLRTIITAATFALIVLSTAAAFSQASGVFNEACYLQRYLDVATGWGRNGGQATDLWL